MDILNTRVYGLAESIFASGYPMRDTMPTEEEFKTEVGKIERSLRAINYKRKVDDLHINRAIKLGSTKQGEGHDNFTNGIIVQFDLNIPIKVWTEAQRYHFLDFVSSMSTMHRLKDFELSYETMDCFVDERIIGVLNELQKKYKESPTKDNLLKLLMNAPVGMNLCARMTTNYRQLKTMKIQRKNHRLPHWHEFCDWCDNELPLFKELVGV